MKTKKLAIEIEFTFGSSFQSKWALNCLFMLLTAWKVSVEEAHKKNQLSIAVNGAALEDITEIVD